MPLMSWSDSLSVNVEEINTQHKRLLELINQLHDAMGQGKGREVVGKVLDGLIDYTRTHFAYEERLMVAQVYPSYLKHKVEHDALTKKVLDLQSRFLSGEIVITMEVMNFLKDWLSTHIMNVDKLFGAYLNGKGIK